MSLFAPAAPNLQKLFLALFHCPDELAVEQLIQQQPAVFAQPDWKPLGGSENMCGVIENQQASPIAALVEKLINSIDATLMRKCGEASLDPKGPATPASIAAAVQRFYAAEARNRDLEAARKTQAENIQVVASGDKLKPSLAIHDDGEWQHPADFEHPFWSLLRGNKNEIHFVQGKYNMGGSGARSE